MLIGTRPQFSARAQTRTSRTNHKATVSLQMNGWMVWLKFDLFPQDVDALGTLNVQATFVNVKTHVPYYNLKVRFLAVFVYLQFLITL